MPYKDPSKNKEYRDKYNALNKEKKKADALTRSGDFKKHVVNSIITGEIIDQHKWEMWCKNIKRGAKKYPYSVDFTNDLIFEMMLRGCFYCGDIANTIDRIDSSYDHTPDNCVASCYSCNCSKGASDISTFIRKAWYRIHEKYIDDTTDIWFVNKQKPRMDIYKRSAEKKRVPFDLENDYFDMLIKGDCEYCKRSPTTWFGIDRIKPGDGYVLDNVVSCCYDCNLDKHAGDVNTMMIRNEKITTRVNIGELVIKKCLKVVLHQGTKKTSKKVCAYGKVYESKISASRTLGKSESYVKKCIKDGTHSNDIFEITDDFYEKYKDSDMYITKIMYDITFA